MFTRLPCNDDNLCLPSLPPSLLCVGHDLETKKTAMPLRKPHGAAVYPLYALLSSKQHDERDVQMEVFV